MTEFGTVSSAGKTDEQEAEIIRKVYGSGYSHAESILDRLAGYERDMSYPAAVARLHEEVVDGAGETRPLRGTRHTTSP